jgi:hypothetical protein
MNFLLCNLIPLESSRKRRIVHSEYLDSLPGFREIVRFEHSDTSLVLSTLPNGVWFHACRAIPPSLQLSKQHSTCQGMRIGTGVIEVTGVMTEVTEVSAVRDLNTEGMMEQHACMLVVSPPAQEAEIWKTSLPSMGGMNHFHSPHQ